MDAAIYRMESYAGLRETMQQGGTRLRSLLRLQNTLIRPIVVEGFGFWTGEDIRVEFRPAPVDTGLVFVRTDLPDEPRIPALAAHRDSKPRQTSLVCGSARVDMVEHVLAAIRALQIDNCEIRVDRPEMPGLDGSSMPFVLALEEAGITPQPGIRPLRIVTRELRVGDEKTWIEAVPTGEGVHAIDYTLEFDGPNPIGNQNYRFVTNPDRFKRELMNCRTFLTKGEADHLLAQGLCRRVRPTDLLVFDKNGPMDNHLHFENECARHKILDMIGDFGLTPCDWVGRFTARRSGHALNVECVVKLENATLLIDESCLPANSELLLKKERLLKKIA
ncbi:MAG TPA: UDP-3-O-[3-hydroxymyristoyl] N-acetylglucosamine deacetylase [Planctomycetaceae bacterium]|nr:UDP-3-O-[3-hydroxymyristoyl] N-acetylglucosamine deacetylase [Planctomycetaceae bacterium]